MSEGALAGFSGGLASLTGIGNWGFFQKARNQYASQVRHLRRREYQDMVFSMKQAGLNPMLATGATPGHSAAYSASPPEVIGDVVGNAARATHSALEADRQGPTIKKMAAEEALARDKAWSERFFREAGERGLAYQLDAMKLNNIATAAQTDKLIQETDESIARTQQSWAEVAKTGVSAKEIQERIKAQQFENVGKENEANFRKTTLGRTLQEIGIGLGDASKLVGPAACFILGRGSKGPQWTKVPTSAAGAASNPYTPSPNSYRTGKFK